ncbi:Zinc finger, CCHC-type, partial [Trema orientale]
LEYSVGNAMMKLNNSNWVIWKPRMEDYLYCEDLHKPIEGDEARPKEISDEEWYVLNRRAVAKIRQWVDHSLFNYVALETNARELWLILESLFEKKTVAVKVSLIKSLMNMKYEKGMSTIKHMNNFQGLFNQLCATDWVLDDEVKALMFLSSLSNEWETFVSSVCDSAPNGVLSMGFVRDKLFEEETRRKIAGLGLTRGSSSGDRNDGDRENRGRSQNRGFRNQSRSRGRSQVKDRRRCYHCGKEGHIRRHCRKRSKIGGKDDSYLTCRTHISIQNDL